MKSLTTKIKHSSRQPQLFFKIMSSSQRESLFKAAQEGAGGTSIHPTPTQSLIQEAYQAANQRVETSRSNSVKPLPPEKITGSPFKVKITGSPFKVTLSQRDHRLEVIDGIVRSRRFLSSGVDYRIDLSKILCTVGEDGLKVGDQTIPLESIIKVKLASENMSVDTMIALARQKSQLSKELAEIQQNLLTTLKTIGLDLIDSKMPDLQQKYDSALSLTEFDSNIRASRHKFVGEMTTELTDGQLTDGQMSTGMIEGDLREFYGKEFDRRLKEFRGKQDDIRLKLFKTLTTIGLDLIDSKMPDLQEKFDSADLLASFNSNIRKSREEFVDAMTAELTGGQLTGGQVSTGMIERDLREFYGKEFDRRLKEFRGKQDDIRLKLFKTLKTIGSDLFVLKMPDLQQKYDSADSHASFNSNIRKSREEFVDAMTAALTDGQLTGGQLTGGQVSTGMIERDLREFYGKEFDRRLKDFLGKQDEIRLKLFKTLTKIGLALIYSKMPDLQEKFDSALSFTSFELNIRQPRYKFAGEMITALTDGQLTGGQVSTKIIKDDLRGFYVEEFNKRLKDFLNSKDIKDLQKKFPEVTMKVSYSVKVREVWTGETYRYTDDKGNDSTDGHWVDFHETRDKEEPADKKTFYERLGI